MHGRDPSPMRLAPEPPTRARPWPTKAGSSAALVAIGVWLMLAPVTFGYARGAVEPPRTDHVWLALEQRAAALGWSDFVCGALVLALGAASLYTARALVWWASCAVALWLEAAPAVFWAPSAAAYLNDTLMGTLIVLAAVVIAGLPGREPSPEGVPSGWSYDPSSWAHRSAILLFAVLSFFVARHLAVFQLGYIADVHDPIFGVRAHRVILSDFIQVSPVADAALGAMAYTVLVWLTLMGDASRHRTAPFLPVLAFALVALLALTHLFLVIAQPVFVGQWCSYCLLNALVMVPLVPLSADELVAAVQTLRDARARGASVWRTLFRGAALESSAVEGALRFDALTLAARAWPGIRVTRPLALSAVLGVVLIATPELFAVAPPAAHVFHVLGPVVVLTSVAAFAEVLRPVRIASIVWGVAIALLPSWLGGMPLFATRFAALIGAALALLALPRGSIREHYGRWDHALR